MKKICKYISVLMIILLVLPTIFLASCKTLSDGGKMSIVCSTFAQYDFTMNILGDASDKFEVSYLLESGTDMHSYSNSISVSDKVRILSCDLFICIGGNSEKWIDELLDDDAAKGVKVIKLIECVGEPVCTSGDAHEDHGHTHAHECDEHIWLSSKRAIMMCDAICDAICELDKENADIYTLSYRPEDVGATQNEPFRFMARRGLFDGEATAKADNVISRLGIGPLAPEQFLFVIPQ